MHKKTLPADFSKQFCTLDAIYLYMKKLILDHGPIDEIASEAAFKGAFAQAYAALLLSIHVVTMASRDTINKDIYKYAPKEVKLTMTNNGAADKDAIKEAVLMNNDIDLSAVDIHNHPSHIFDAIAVGYTHVTKKHKAN
jgi:Holliday junction resolvasome RuvABC endonuclease subunit